MKGSVRQLQDRLSEVLDRVAESGEEFVVERNGKACAVIVNARQWRRREAGRRLDALGPAYRLSGPKQARSEELLAANRQRRLSAAERRELKGLLQESDAILVRRAEVLEHLT